MKKYWTIALWLCAAEGYSQGCVAIRSQVFSASNPNDLMLGQGDLQVGMGYRYFKSFRHYRGTHEEPDRVANGTEVINHNHYVEWTLNYWLSSRASLVLGIPAQINTRSSLYEHGRNERNTTFSRGMGDVRIGMQYTLRNPSKQNWNGQVGLSAKLPTGNYAANDIFYNVGPGGTPQVRPVDQSIQLGDGGFGFIGDFFVYSAIGKKLFASAGGFYMCNPRETNGVRTFRETLNPLLQNESVMSVPDQFSVRANMNYAPNHHHIFSLGARYEGVPVYDFVGGSKGFRRPGNVLSAEPGYSYTHNNLRWLVSVPVAVRRERPQSVTDIEVQRQTGTTRHGDAAFADYAVNFSVQMIFRSNKPSPAQMVH
jgi:hypothetical protein